VSKGVKIVGIGDHTAALYDPKGFEIQAAIEARRQTSSS
jgi:glutamate dehydrogenase/leucine dehydrogenase